MKVDISPNVALKEAQAEIAFLRNRNLILAQAVEDLQQKLVVKAPAPSDTSAELVDVTPA